LFKSPQFSRSSFKSSSDNHSHQEHLLDEKDIVGGNISFNRHKTAGNHSRITTHSGGAQLNIELPSSFLAATLDHNKLKSKVAFLLYISAYGFSLFASGSSITYIELESQGAHKYDISY
jgi:hypothetical protein